VVVFGWQILAGHSRIHAALTLAGALFVGCFLWLRHRGWPRIDSSADARAYRSALVARIDDQIRLVQRLGYWYVLPLYPPVVWTTVETWRSNRLAAVVGWAMATGLCFIVGRTYARAALDHLREERERLLALWRDSEDEEEPDMTHS
jgi:hypothetical protein